MSIEENKALALRWFAGEPPPNMTRMLREAKDPKVVMEKMIRSVVEELFVPDFTLHFQGEHGNRESVIQLNLELLSAFPDTSFKVDKIIAEGDMVAVLGRSQGTHLGLYQGIPSTGKKIGSSYMAMVRIVGRKIAEEWIYTDTSVFMQQLRAISKK